MKRQAYTIASIVIIASLWAACSAQRRGSTLDNASTGSTQITSATLAAPIRFLASDLLEGRGPGTRGDLLARLYIATQMQALGLEPGGVDGSWEQPVPLLGVTGQLGPLGAAGTKSSLALTPSDDFVSFRFVSASETVSLGGEELVFAGYGIQAPEYQWDDYKDTDVRGKVVLLLYNDPDWDPALFAGKRRVYYGTPQYKIEAAARRGAKGIVLIHTRESAGWPWQVAQTSSAGEQSRLIENTRPQTDVCLMVTEDSARRLAALGGHDLSQLVAAAHSRDFAPVRLNVTLRLRIENQLRRYESANVVGILRGRDPQLRDESVVFTAHHDHLGLKPRPDGTLDIYNGAVDNAAGVAQLLAIARAFTALRERPRRSIVFVTVTAEEQGLLGSEYFAVHPTLPSGHLVAEVNFDGGNVFGRTRDVSFVGGRKSSLYDLAAELAQRQGRSVVDELFPEDGAFYRSDQFSFARVGVPVLWARSGTDVIGRPPGWGKEQRLEFIAKRYHQPSDDFDPKWDLGGMVDDAQLAFAVGLDVDNADQPPAWLPGDEFAAARRPKP
ncbi:MAG: M28 family peptidase [Deltaproteobacteria bacterium]|nr:M28 family peptidase [Deltaproteobacteria bacterium]MBI3390008.1 M28 family peptidase [Deltaproteobacteria bacterium]